MFLGRLGNLIDWASRHRSGVFHRLASSLAAGFGEEVGCDAIASESHLIHPPRAVVQKSVREGVSFPVDPWLVVSPLPRCWVEEGGDI
jgi:hypothetical protein